MYNIKTNFTRNCKFVMTNDESKVVAIINVPIGALITDQVLMAVKEELIQEQVFLTHEVDFDEFDYEATIKVKIIDEDNDNDCYTLDFDLTLTEEY